MKTKQPQMLIAAAAMLECLADSFASGGCGYAVLGNFVFRVFKGELHDK